MNMDFQTACSALGTVTARDEVVMLLQQITAFLLKGGVLEVYGVECRPLELESYFYRAGVFEDAYVHENERQLNHFGELYVHRIGALARRTTRWIIACASAFAFPIAPIIITVP